ncbi:hypothetical protein ACXX9E_29300 [Pseudomonas sp. GNP014]
MSQLRAAPVAVGVDEQASETLTCSGEQAPRREPLRKIVENLR